MKHLRYKETVALMDFGESRNPLKVIQELGITFQKCTRQTVCDQYWFWNCDNLPKELPEYLTELKLDPMDCINYGLSKEDAEEIQNFNLNI